MKKAMLVFIIMVVTCSVSFAGSMTSGKILDTTGKLFDGGAIVNRCIGGPHMINIASDAKDVAEVGYTGVSVAGASGSEIMSTMAAAGEIIGGGVVAGTAITAGVGSFGAAGLMNKYGFDGDTEGDKAARFGTYSGATIGTAAAVGTLVTVGAGPTGLATIGAIIGGGMATGATMVLAAPILAAGTLGCVFYWLASDSDEDNNK